MKKHFSVFALVLRQKLKWALIFILAAPVISLSVYRFAFLGKFSLEPGTFQVGSAYLAFYFPFLLCSLGVAVVCCGLFPGKSHPRYLLARLRISERMVLVWEMIACALLFLLLWQIEIMTIVTAGLMHNASEYNLSGVMDVVVAMYNNPFYRAIVPLSEISLWVRNICFVLCSGAVSACVSHYPGDSSSRGLGIATLAILAVFYTSGWSVEGVFFIVLFASITVVLTVKRLHNGKARSGNEAMDC